MMLKKKNVAADPLSPQNVLEPIVKCLRMPSVLLYRDPSLQSVTYLLGMMYPVPQTSFRLSMPLRPNSRQELKVGVLHHSPASVPKGEAVPLSAALAPCGIRYRNSTRGTLKSCAKKTKHLFPHHDTAE